MSIGIVVIVGGAMWLVGRLVSGAVTGASHYKWLAWLLGVIAGAAVSALAALAALAIALVTMSVLVKSGLAEPAGGDEGLQVLVWFMLAVPLYTAVFLVAVATRQRSGRPMNVPPGVTHGSH